MLLVSVEESPLAGKTILFPETTEEIAAELRGHARSVFLSYRTMDGCVILPRKLAVQLARRVAHVTDWANEETGGVIRQLLGLGSPGLAIDVAHQLVEFPHVAPSCTSRVRRARGTRPRRRRRSGRRACARSPGRLDDPDLPLAPHVLHRRRAS